MSSNQDARPFVDLRKDAKEFVEKFDGDIETIIAFLDAKITTLICDQDSPESPSKRGTVKSSALVEFSKAKFDIFNNVKSVMNQMEREWMKYILAMKKLFVENVEIFLAGTKLEVKLPTTEFQTSPSYKQSSRKDKPSLAESIYPIIPMFNSFAKNVAGFRSPFKKTDDNLDQGRRSRELKDRSYTVDENSSDSEETEDERDSQRKEKGNQSSGSKSESYARQLQPRAVSSSPKKYTESSSSDSESESVFLEQSISQRSAKPKGTPKIPTETRNSSRRSSSSANDTQSTEPQKDGPLNKATKKSVTSTRGTKSNVSRVATSSPKSYADLHTTSEGESANETDSTEPQQGQRQTRTRNKSLTASTQGTKSNASRVASSSPKSYAEVMDTSSEGESESNNEELSRSISKKGKAVAKGNKGSIAASKQKAKKNNEKGLDSSRRSTRDKSKDTEMSSSSSDAKETSVSSNRAQPRDKTGQFRPFSSIAQATPKAKVALQKDTIPTPAMRNQARKLVTEKNEDDDMKETSHLTRGRKGQQPVAPPVKQTPRSLRKKNTTSEESEDTSKSETNSSNARSSRQRGGRTPARAVKPVKDVTQSGSKGDKARPAKHKLENSSDMDVPRSSRMKGTRGATPAPPSPMKSNLSSSTSIELDAPRSPKKVTFTPMRTLHLDDNMDEFTPSVKSKAAVRRKTLLPNLNMDISEDDVTPAISRGRAKRKTIGGISDLASATPPKRLKANERGKGVSSSQAEEDTDNLLESDGNYSDWMSLKSIDAKVPPKSGVYELKVWRAKKCAYIGHCESLRQKLTLHKLQHNSGHKHLDKFIERNKDDIQIRYEVFPTVDNAKAEVKNRVKSFTAQYNTTPAYN